MKKRFSLYHFIIAVLFFTFVTPSFAEATKLPEKGSLTIHKYEQDPNDEKGEGDGTELENPPKGKPLPGVTFKIQRTHAFDGEKWTPVEEEPFTMTTGEDGKVTRQLLLGRYEVKEISGPEHVILNTETMIIDIPMTSKDGTSLNYHVHIYPKNVTIYGGAKLIKYKNNSQATLDGVQFKVFHKNGDPVVDDNNEPIILTTENGKVTINGLKYGDYYFEEIATVDGYLLNGKKIEFSIKKANEIVKVSHRNYEKPRVVKKVNDQNAVYVNRNQEVTFTLNITIPEDIKDYKRFIVLDELDDRLIYVPGSAQVPSGFSFSVEDDNTLKWVGNPENLTPGNVTLSFKAKVAETAPGNEAIYNKAKIDYDNSYVSGKEPSNKVKVTPTVGSLKVIKQDGSDKTRLAGAIFELYDANGTLVAQATTDENGEIDFGELDYGNYTLQETKAPEGYRLITKPYEITIGGGKDKHHVTLYVDNYKSEWELPQTGGIGTTLFTLTGVTLMAASLWLYMRKRKGEVA